MLAFIYLPVVVLVLFSFQSGDLPVPPFDGPSLRWYQRAFANDRLTNSLWNSLLVGGLSAAAATLLGFLSAYGMFRRKPAAAAAVRLLLIAPLMVSYLIIGLGLLIVFNTAGLGRSLFAVGIGHVVINLPLCYAIIYSQFGDHLCNIDNAAHDLGAGDRHDPAPRDRAGYAAGDHRRVLPLIHLVLGRIYHLAAAVALRRDAARDDLRVDAGRA